MENKNEIWTPPLSPKDRKKLDHTPKKWIKAFLNKWSQAIAAILVMLPIISLAITVWQYQQQRRDDKEKELNQQIFDLHKIKENLQNTILQSYLDRMSDLVFKYNLRTSNSGDPVRAFASAQTIEVLDQLDLRRKNILIRFLYTSALIRPITDPYHSHEAPIIDMYSANLDYIDLSNNDLIGANFNHAKLNHAQLNTRDTDLTNADLTRAHMSYANLDHADLDHARLDHTDLSSANLDGAYLYSSILSRANLTGAKLIRADLTEADLYGAKMNNKTDLRGAILQRAKYNIRIMQEKDTQGYLVPTQPTQWPKGFDPKAAGATCVDCKKTPTG